MARCHGAFSCFILFAVLMGPIRHCDHIDGDKGAGGFVLH